MLMAVEGPYALMVQPDDILISPREVDEHFGKMACFHPRYALGDSHNYMDKDDFLREMYLDTVGHDEAGLKRYEHMVNIVSSRFRHDPKTEERAVDDAMMKVISDKNTLRCPFISWITAALPCRLQVSMIPGTAGRWDGFMFPKRTP